MSRFSIVLEQVVSFVDMLDLSGQSKMDFLDAALRVEKSPHPDAYIWVECNVPLMDGPYLKTKNIRVRIGKSL